MQKLRESASKETKTNQKKSDALRKLKQRQSASKETKTNQKKSDALRKHKQRQSASKETKENQKKEAVLRMQQHRESINTDSTLRLRKFRRECRYGPIFTCVCCMRDLFRKTVKKVTNKYLNFLLETMAVADYLQTEGNIKLKEDLKVFGDHYLCSGCCRYLQKGEMPPICAKNGLEYEKIPDCLQLVNLERQIICKNLIFLKVRQLPKTRMPIINDRVINVPIDDDDIIKTVNSLPRTELNNGMVTVGLKRDKEMKNCHKIERIRPSQVKDALLYLKENHPSYESVNISNLDAWEKQYNKNKDSIDNPEEDSGDEHVEDLDENDEDHQEKNVFNFATCLIPEDPLSNVVGMNNFYLISIIFTLKLSLFFNRTKSSKIYQNQLNF